MGERDPDAIAGIAARRRGDARVFTVGVSADVNSSLIERLAIEGRGTAHFVRTGENVERPVSLLASRLTNPVLTNVRVSVDGVRLTQVLPAGPLDVFAGQDLVLLARYEGDGRATIRIDGQSASGRASWTTDAQFGRRVTQNAFVPRLWATQRIGWLAAEKRRRGGNTEMDAEIKALGERYGIPTEFSSYLVVEPGMRAAVVGRARDMGAGMPALATNGAPASAPAPSAAEARFEMSRQAAAQRDAKSIAVIDSMSAVSGTRQVGDAPVRAAGESLDGPALCSDSAHGAGEGVLAALLRAARTSCPSSRKRWRLVTRSSFRGRKSRSRSVRRDSSR